jgi:multiple antibiotic resistance protein
MNGNMVGLALLIGIMGIMMAASFAVFLASERLERLLGVQGEMVLGRLLGVLLAALAVQYVADGILALSQH